MCWCYRKSENGEGEYWIKFVSELFIYSATPETCICCAFVHCSHHLRKQPEKCVNIYYRKQRKQKTTPAGDFESYHITFTNIKIEGFSGSREHICKCFWKYLLRELGVQTTTRIFLAQRWDRVIFKGHIQGSYSRVILKILKGFPNCLVSWGTWLEQAWSQF